jgi:DNA-binding NarL/FixJ family response regulator
VRVVIADDTPLLRHGIARLLGEAGVEVCGEAADATALLELVQREQPDVAIVDIRMPPTHTDEGLVAAAIIRSEFPATGVLVLSHYIEASYVLRLLDALNRVAAGEVVVDRELVDSLVSRPRDPNPLSELTEREREVLSLIAEGLTDRGIADRLWLTPNTIETHVRHILRKLDLPADTAHNRRVRAVLTYLRA